MKRRANRIIERRRRQGEEGVILLMVVLLVAMFSGLGLLAMRHTQSELRSSNAYLDATQASAIAESAIMMVATDMRANWRYPNRPNACLNYYSGFNQALANVATGSIELGFSDVFNTGEGCVIGKVPNASLNGTSPLALTGGPLDYSYADVSISQSVPVVAPPPPGFSTDDESRTYDWYYFEVTGAAEYGFPNQDISNLSDSAESKVIRGEAVVRSHMKIGPVDSISGY